MLRKSWGGWDTGKLSDNSTYLRFSEPRLYGKYVKHRGNIDLGQVGLLSDGVRVPTKLSSGEKKRTLPACKLGHCISYSAAWQRLLGKAGN